MNELCKNNLLKHEQKTCLVKCSYQLLYLLKVNFSDNDDIIFKITGSTLNVYTVIFSNNTFKCDCHNTNKSVFCKHICFIICYVCKLYDPDIFINLKFNSYHKIVLLLKLFTESFYKDTRVYDSYLSNKYDIVLKVINSSYTNTIRNKECQCAVCYEKLDEYIYTCRCCNNAIHDSCSEKWSKYNNTCIFCKEYIVPKDLRYKNENGYINIA